MKLFNQPVIYYFELAARLYAGLLLSVYGLGKIMGGQFFLHGKIPVEVGQIPLAEASGFQLAWVFFGFSQAYIWFIGGSQLLGSALLLFERTKLLGIAILLPILANIIVVDYNFDISTGAMFSATCYLSALLFVAFCNRERIGQVLAIMLAGSDENRDRTARLTRWGIAVLLVGGFFFLEQVVLNVLGR
jgi:hypothetical protein